MRSIALMSLIFTLFALFFSALLYYSKVLYTLTIFPTFFLQLLRMLRRLLLKERSISVNAIWLVVGLRRVWAGISTG